MRKIKLSEIRTILQNFRGQIACGFSPNNRMANFNNIKLSVKKLRFTKESNSIIVTYPNKRVKLLYTIKESK